MTLLDIILNGVFTGLGTGIGVIIAELWVRDRLVKNKENFDKKMSDVKKNLNFL